MNTRTFAPHPGKPSRVILHYWGRRGGGSEIALFLAKHLSAAAEPIEVTLSLASQNADMAVFTSTGLPIIAFDRPRLFTLLRDIWLLPARLRRHADKIAASEPAVAIVVMNAPFSWPFTRLLQRRGIKVVYVAHDAEPHPGDYAATWQRITQDLLIKSADKVVALSNSVAVRIADRLPTSGSKITVIPLETIYPTHRSAPSRAESSKEPLRLLFYGRLLPYKGLDLLARALEPLRQNRNWRLTVAGSGPLEAEVRRSFTGWPQVELRLGWISHEETAELFAGHDLLLCPYVEASQSGVVAQALSWAMPSLVMPMGALPEQIGFGRAGLIAHQPTAESLGLMLRQVLEHSEGLAQHSQGAATLLGERQINRGWVDLVTSESIHQEHPHTRA